MGFVLIANERKLGDDVSVRPSACTYRLLGCRWGGRTASGDGIVRTIFLGWKSRSGTRLFLAGNHACDGSNEMKSRKEHERRGEEI